MAAEPTVPPPRPPEEVAFEKLEAAERSGWLEEGEVKLFHVAVSEAVREYLGGRYGFDSLEQTTEELLVYVPAANNDADASTLEAADILHESSDADYT